MSIVSLDFETPFGKGAQKGHILHKFSLRSLTYEEYILDPRFRVFGGSIKIDDGPTKWYSSAELEKVLNEIFTPGNGHTMVAHNAMFDGAILSWFYGLAAARYWCTQRMSKAIWNQRSASLEALCVSCYPDDETIRKGKELESFANLYELDPEQEAGMARYCDNDVDIMFACLKVLWPLIPDDEMELLDLTLQAFIHPVLEIDEQRLLDFLDEYNTETNAIIAASGVSRSVLASPKKFVAWVKDNLGLDIPIIDAPTAKNPDNRKAALGKDELAFVDFCRENNEYQHIWKARLRVASTIARSRAERMIKHARLNGGRLAMPLNYYVSHTGRWGGTNKCVTPDHEVLTPAGWVPVPEAEGLPILVVSDTLAAKWEIPSWNKSIYQGPLVSFSHSSVSGRFTPNHRIATLPRTTRDRITAAPEASHFITLKGSRKIPTTATFTPCDTLPFTPSRPASLLWCRQTGAS
ncbi:3'-5' exonuclease family protein [Kineobactrum salinum]|uniref:Uncharacterized protein n=1 Tax=Kineobactrum salinum TaxID=2708301 RepID=A0A6C0U7Z4_9GAMM|nr:hypothetical protein [Kineobactrum salinum]QIB67127.1 hypothetical protein G3T16_18715 [Kineobactrum salinum]